MLPKIHIIFGLAFSILLFLIFPTMGWIGFLIIFLSSFLIDIDHYLYYVYRTGKWSIKDSFRWFLKNKKLFNSMNRQQKDKIYTGLCFLHGIEAIILLLIAWLIFYPNNFVFFIILGFVFHQLLDTIHIHTSEYRYDKVISFIYSVKQAKKRKLLQEI